MQTLWQDLRYGARMMWKHPGFTAVAVLTLALGIGANTAIFSMINSVLIKALPYPQAEQLVRVWDTLPNGGRASVTAGSFKDWRAHSTKLAHVALVKDYGSISPAAGRRNTSPVCRSPLNFSRCWASRQCSDGAFWLGKMRRAATTESS